jgi:hypothetical protein
MDVNQHTRGFVIAIAAMFALMVLIVWGYDKADTWRRNRPYRERARFFLEEIDHHAALEQCRRMMEDPAFYRSLPPDDPRLPSIVRRLEPKYLFIEEDFVRIEMGGGADHHGLLAFAGDAPKERIDKELNAPYRHNRIEPIDGLWCYSETPLMR